MEPNAHRSRSMSDVSSFSTVYVLSVYPIRVRALCVVEPQLGCISSVMTWEPPILDPLSLTFNVGGPSDGLTNRHVPMVHEDQEPRKYQSIFIL